MSAFGGPPRVPTVVTNSSESQAPSPRESHNNNNTPPPPPPQIAPRQETDVRTPASADNSIPSSPAQDTFNTEQTVTVARTRARADSRPTSIFQAYQPPMMEVAKDTLPELQPIFSFLNSHSNKLYQEGYFLKLNDLDAYGRAYSDRHWTECFAQLVGTVLSLWDAAALDAAGQDGEVPPTFINLADASIKMIETLPTRSQETQPLQNVLSVSTAGKNRYLFHFNSLHSLTQWTAGIRLAMFEHASLQEAYTGSLIAGKGKFLNNIRVIMDRARFKQEDWARVRFGAGTPWRRCWCVISPPDEKEFQKLQKTMKKRSAYDKAPVLKGNVKFYDTKKVTKKTKPIATINDAYSAYAIYPQSKPLIDQSTLVKLDGRITIHSQPETTTDGFIFVMPEIHPAVTGFEIMLRWLFPVFDTFGLYGRPNRLVADTLDTRSLMFAFPQERKYGYLEILDVAGLILTDGSQAWTDKDWRQQMRDLTARRMLSKSLNRDSMSKRDASGSIQSRARAGSLRYDDGISIRSTPSVRHNPTRSTESIVLPPSRASTDMESRYKGAHSRSRSEAVNMGNMAGIATPPRRNRAGTFTPGQVDGLLEHPLEEFPPPPPPHGSNAAAVASQETLQDRSSSDEEAQDLPPELQQGMRPSSPPQPVQAPPAFSHQPYDKPSTRLRQSPEAQRRSHRMSTATLTQMYEAGRQSPSPQNSTAAAGAAAAWKARQPGPLATDGQHGVNTTTAGNAGPYTDNKFGLEVDIVSSPQQASPATPMVNPLQMDTRYSRSSPSLQLGRPQTPPSMINKAVTRKPVGSSSPQARPYQNQDYGSTSGLRNVIDQSTLNQPRGVPPLDYMDDHRDDESNASPDYASRPSTDSRHSVASIPKPRMGALKTVGNVEPGAVISNTQYVHQQQIPVQSDIPAVDFGPTMSYDPLRKSSGQVTPRSRDSSAGYGSSIPKDEKRLSQPMLDYHSRSKSSSPHGTDEQRRSVAWQPGSKLGGRNSPGPNLTPEDFVQQRSVSRKALPVYAHQRSASTTPPPPPRTPSGDWTPSNRHSRNLSKELPSRPNSRGAAATMNYAPARPSSRGAGAVMGESSSRPHSRGASTTLANADYGSQLSAREQEHVARVTGTPLISLGSNTNTSASPGGLIGAIDQRERERRDMREGLSGHMVQQTIAHRQRQSQQMYQQHVRQQSSQMNLGYTQPSMAQPMYQQTGYSVSQPALNSPQAWDSFVQRQSMANPAYGGMTPQQMQQMQQMQQQYGGYYQTQ